MGIYADNRPGKHTKSEPENGNLVRGFTHEKGWIFPVRYVNVYQRVKYVEIHIWFSNPPALTNRDISTGKYVSISLIAKTP